jgi:cell wall-associated NlpC family hydrolase
MYLHCPYLWGGRSPFGVDCSGYTQMVFKLAGKRLRRDTHMQAEQGMTVYLLDEAQPGDLAFFDDDNGNIIHTGILLSKNKIIHASGRVRIDLIDYHGIYNEALRRYTHRLRLIKRIL